MENMTVCLALGCLGALTAVFLGLAFTAFVCFKEQYLPMQSVRGEREVAVEPKAPVTL